MFSRRVNALVPLVLARLDQLRGVAPCHTAARLVEKELYWPWRPTSLAGRSLQPTPAHPCPGVPIALPLVSAAGPRGSFAHAVSAVRLAGGCVDPPGSFPPATTGRAPSRSLRHGRGSLYTWCVALGSAVCRARSGAAPAARDALRIRMDPSAISWQLSGRRASEWRALRDAGAWLALAPAAGSVSRARDRK